MRSLFCDTGRWELTASVASVEAAASAISPIPSAKPRFTYPSAFSFYPLVKIARAFEHDLHPRRYQYDAARFNPETF